MALGDYGRLLLMGATVTGCLLATARAEDLTHLGLEELLNLKVEVTSAAKKPQALSDVAAAVTVLTADDIRRSGATSIPEALRFVPGLDVARVDRNAWAISARGFNSTFANKLLVLIDGRSIYSPLFSGVFWALETTMLEDVERIEVIRGPGAALWGANAVNGVINIITKDAAATQGTLLVAGGGTEKTDFEALRHGGAFGEDGHYRVYAQRDRMAAGTSPTGGRGSDGSSSQQAGFRADWKGSAVDAFSLIGGAHGESRGESSVVPSFSPPYATVFNGRNNDFAGNFLGRWTRTLSASSNLSVQAYYTHEGYNRPDIRTLVDIGDIEAQHRFSPAAGHDVIWGGGYRWSNSRLDGTPIFQFVPAASAQSLFSAFLQDDWTLVPQRLHLIAGSKFEHNDFTGFEVEPNLRLLWTPDARQSVWTAVSRAVRTPSVGEEHINGILAVTPGTPPVAAQILGSSAVRSEKVVALEAGYRISPLANLSFDTSVFYNINRDQVGNAQQTPVFVPLPTPHLLLPLQTNNAYESDSWGGEIASEWKPMAAWRLRASYSYLSMDVRLTDQGSNSWVLATAHQSPRHQAVLQSSSDLGHDLEFDVSLKHVSALPAFSVGAYTTADVRLGWRGLEGVELSVVGQNLLGGSRLQFVPDLLPWIGTRVGPSVYGKAVIRF